MSTPNIPDAANVIVEKPSEGVLCDILTFALMLSSLRRLYPRLHYRFPAFATFCRGEEVIGSALQDLAQEIDEVLQALSKASLEHLVRLRTDVGTEKIDVYQWAHFRGRTFDRERTEPVPKEDRQSFLSDMNLNPQAKTLGDVYDVLLKGIVALAFEANKGDGVLKQSLKARHVPPELPTFLGEDPQERSKPPSDEI